MSKSAVACEFSLEMVTAGRPDFYLWTFTFPDVVPCEVAASRWSDLSRELVRVLGMQGVRVFELHPGGHGLHVHMVTPFRHSVRRVRYYSKRFGFGRIHVAKKPAAAIHYIAKYLHKSKRAACLKGKRLWSCVGFVGSRVSDIVCDSPLSRKIAWVKANMSGHVSHVRTWAGFHGDKKRVANNRYYQMECFNLARRLLYDPEILFKLAFKSGGSSVGDCVRSSFRGQIWY